MQALLVLALLVGVVAFVAHIWLTVRAFKRHAGWGLAVFFLSPFAAVFFAIKNWEEAKKPFLAYTGSVVVCVGLVVIVFARLGGMAMMSMAGMEGQDLSDEQVAGLMVETMDKWQDSGMFNEADQRKMEQMKQLLKAESGSENPTSRASLMPTTASRPPATTPEAETLRTAQVVPHDESSSSMTATTPKRVRGAIALDEAGDYVGRFVEVQTFEGPSHRGILNEVGTRTLTLEQHTAAGSMAFEMSLGEIQSLELAWR